NGGFLFRLLILNGECPTASSRCCCPCSPPRCWRRRMRGPWERSPLRSYCQRYLLRTSEASPLATGSVQPQPVLARPAAPAAPAIPSGLEARLAPAALAIQSRRSHRLVPAGLPGQDRLGGLARQSRP